MRPIATDVVAWSMCLCVRHRDEPCRTVKPIMMPLGRHTHVGSRNHACISWGAHWRQLANTINRSVRRQICGLSLPLLVTINTALCTSHRVRRVVAFRGWVGNRKSGIWHNTYGLKAQVRHMNTLSVLRCEYGTIYTLLLETVPPIKCRGQTNRVTANATARPGTICRLLGDCGQF